jgi:hypothetical protein
MKREEWLWTIGLVVFWVLLLTWAAHVGLSN